MFNLENTDERLVEFFSKDKPFAEAFKCLFENASDAIYILDKHGNFVTVNHKAEELTGFRREDFVGKSFRKIIPLKSLPKAIRGFLDVMRGKEVRLELEVKRAANKTVLVEVTSRQLIIKGKIVGTLGIVRDITERVQIENKLKETNRKLEMLFDTAMEGITVVDAKENLIFVNNAFTDMLGYEEDELIGMNLQKFVDGQGFKEIRRQTESRKKGKVSRYELVMFGKDGKPRIFQVSASPLWNEDGHFAGSLAILMDVTKRKRAEEALRESGERYKELTESISDVFFAMDKNLRYTYWNKASENLTGISAKNAIGKSLIEIFPDVKGTRVEQIYKEALRTQQPQSFVNEYLVGGKDYVFEINAYPTKTGLSVFVKDITERKKAEEKLIRLSNAVKMSADSIVIGDLDAKIMDVNEVTLKMYGTDNKRDLIGKSSLDLIAPEDREKALAGMKEVLEKEYSKDREYNIITKDGCRISVEMNTAIMKDVDGKPIGFVAISRDITERKQMQKKLEEYSQQLEQMVEKRTRQLKEAQEQLIKSERLAAIGEVAAMVGHDLRNPLTSMSGATYYLKTKLDPRMDEKTREMFELIEKDIQHANKIITDLLEYSREIRLEMTETTTKSIIKEALSLIEIPKNVKVIDSTQNEPKIKMDIDKMKRVFANFIKNAVEAMPEGGKLTISTKESDGNVEIMFIDTGIGMAKEVMEKIWTPFFTTKAEGMGLGLPICKRVIEAHGGKISVESIVGEGTTFAVTIPVEPKSKEKGGGKIWANVPESLLSTTMKA